MNKHIDDLYAILESKPDDWEIRRVLADAMEEAGDAIGAEGQRWQIKHKKHALCSTPPHRAWTWFRSKSAQESIIPRRLLGQSVFKRFHTLQEAEHWLAERLQGSNADRINQLYSIVEANSENWEMRRLLADAMEEAGDVVGSQGQRWQIENRKAPEPHFEAWGWFLSNSPSNHHFVLDDDRLKPVASGGTHWKRFKTLRDCERWLAERLDEIKEAG